MKRKKDSNGITSIRIGLFFLAFIFFIVLISLIIKGILLIRESHFDSSSKFTITVTDNKNTKIMSFSPKDKSIGVIELSQNIKPDSVGQFLKIPIDGFINSQIDTNQKIDSLFLNMILQHNTLKTNLTIIDILKLFSFARTTPQSAISIKKILPNASFIDNDKIVSKFVSDELIEKDNQTIQIINGTNISGLGNRLARFITNMGGNVIIVATENSHRKISTISHIDKKTYTVEKLEKILGFKTILIDNKTIADITITIGKDKINSLPF